MNGAASRGPDRAALTAFGLVAVFGGVNAIAVKLMVIEMPPFWSAALRFLAAGLILGAITLATRREWPRRASLVGAIAYGTLGLGASYGFIYAALRDVPAGTAMVLVALAPLFTFALAIAHGQERFRPLGLVGAVVAASGVAIVFGEQLTAAVPLVPLVLVVVGTLAIAESAVIVKLIPKTDPFSTNAVAMLAGGGVLLCVSLVAGEGFALPASPTAWLALAYLVALGSVALFALYVFALGRWTASGMSYTTLLMPLVTVVFAALLFDDEISPLFAVGGAVIVAGVYIGSFVGRAAKAPTATPTPECLPVLQGVAPSRGR